MADFGTDSQMGMSLGFTYDPSGADQWINATTNIIRQTDALGLSQQRLATQSTTMKTSVQSTVTSLQAQSGGLNQNNILTQNLAGSNERLTGSLANVQVNLDKTANSGKGFLATLQANVGQISLAVGALTGLIFSFTQLSRAHFIVERSTVMVEAAQLRVDTITTKLSQTIAKYGANSAEAASVQDKLTLAEKRSELSKTRLGLQQTRYNETLVQFGTQLVPTVIGVASGLVQVFSNIEIKAAAAAIATQLFGTALRAALTVTGIGIALFALSVVMDGLTRKSTDTKDALVDMADETGVAMDDASEGFTTGTQEITTAAVSMADAIKAMKTSVASGGEDLAAELTTIKKNLVASLTISDDDVKKEGGTSIFDLPKKLNDLAQKTPQLFEVPTLPRTATNIGGTSTTTAPVLPEHFAAIGPNLPAPTAGTRIAPAPNLAATPQNLEALATVTKKVDDTTVSAAKSEETYANLIRLGNVAFQERVTTGKAVLAELGALAPVTDQNAAAMAELSVRLKEAASTKNVTEFQKIKDEMVTLALEVLFNVDNTEALATAWQAAADTPLTNTLLDIVNNTVTLSKETEKSLSWEKQRAQDIKNTSSALKENNDLAKQVPADLGKLIGIEKQYSLTMETKTGLITEYDEKLIQQEDLERRVATAVTSSNAIQGQSKQVIAAVAQQAEDLTAGLQTQSDGITASNILWDNMSVAMQKIITDYQDAANASIDMTRAITNQTYQQYLVNKGQIEGRLATQAWVDSLYEATAAEETQKLMTEAVVETYMKIPPALNLTIENLQNLQEEYVRTGDNAKTMDDLLNKTFASSRKAVTDLVGAAVEGGKKWKEAWKDLNLSFIPKSERGETKDFINDLADLQQAATDIAGPLGIFMGLLENGRINGKENAKWTADLTEGMRNMRKELGDIVGMDVAKNIFDPLIKFKKDGLTQDEVQIWAAVANEYERLSNLPGVWTDERTRQLSSFTQKLLDNKAAADADSVSYDKLGDSADELGKKILTLDSGLQTLSTKKGKTPKTTGKIDEVLSGVLAIDTTKWDELIKNDKAISAMKDITTAAGDAQTALGDLAKQGSNSVSILAKNTGSHITSMNTYLNKTLPVAAQNSQTALANLATQGSNSMSILVNAAKAHVTTLATYFGTTIPDAIQKAIEAFVRFSVAQQIFGGGGGDTTTNGPKATNVGFPSIGIGIGDIQDIIDWASKQNLGDALSGAEWNRQFKARQALINTTPTSTKQLTAAAGFNAAEGGITFGKGTGLGGGNGVTGVSGAGDPGLDVINRQINQVIANLGALAKTSSTAMTGFANNTKTGVTAIQTLQVAVNSLVKFGTTNFNAFAKTSSAAMSGLSNNLQVGIAAIQTLQIAVSSLVKFGTNNLNAFAKVSSTDMGGFSKNLHVGIIAIQTLQIAIGSLVKFGTTNLNAFAKASSTTMNGLDKNLSVGEVAAQQLQKGIANLANQGTKSLNALAKASSTDMNGFDKNLSKGEVAAQQLQKGIANLSNQGIKSLNSLAKASSTDMNGMDKNMSKGEVAAQHLQKGLANLSNQGSKSLNALAHASSTAMNGLVNNFKKGESEAKSLTSALNKIPTNITVHYSSTGSTAEGHAKGGLISFAQGGHISAAAGMVFETHGERTVTIGDNPGGHESIWAIPHNNPAPTLKKIVKMFGGQGKGLDMSTSSNSNDNAGDNGNGVEVINLNINEEKMMTWIRRKLGRNRQGR